MYYNKCKNVEFRNTKQTHKKEKTQEFKKASSLVEAPNVDKKPDETKLKKMLLKTKDIQERNKQITRSCGQGCSQHMIVKVLDTSQLAVYGVTKMSRGDQRDREEICRSKPLKGVIIFP